MRETIKTMLIIFLGFGLTSIAPKKEKNVQEGQWVKIAQKTVNFKSEVDVVHPFGAEKKVDKIKIKCVRGAIKLRKVRVEMVSGMKEEYNAKGIGIIIKGASSLPFSLPGDDHKLRKIELEYDALGEDFINKKAKIEVWGRKYE